MAPTEMHIVGGSICGADVHQPQGGVIRHSIPYGASAAGVPSMPRIPGLYRRRELSLILRALGGIAWHREESPTKRPALPIVGGDVAARTGEIGAAVAHDDEIAGEQRCTGERIGLVLRPPNQRVDLPHQLTRLCIERVQPAIERTCE